MLNRYHLKHLLFAVLMLTTPLALRAQQKAYAMKVVKTLASPAFKGRGYVGDGEKIAATYIAGEFRKSGLIPLNKGSYFQDFNIPVNTFPGKVELKLNDLPLVTAVDYLVSATTPSVKGTFPVITVDRKDISSNEKIDALLQQAKSSFILLDNRSSETEEGSLRSKIDAVVNRLKTDEDLDFKGLIVYTQDKLTWTTLTYQSSRPVLTVNKKALDLKSIRTITVDIEAKWIPDYTTRNVGGMIKGSSGSDSTIVISAHFDHLGMLGNKVYFPGANDNASGVAMMLSFVKHFAKQRPKYNTVFLAFSAEEIGILGSKAFVEKPLIDLSKIKFLVNFDLAGTGEEGIKVVNGTVFKDKFDKLVSLNAQFNLVPKVEIRGEACKSDHCMFYNKGVPSFFIYTQGGIAAYHDIYDKSETLPLTEFDDYFKLMAKFFDML